MTGARGRARLAGVAGLLLAWQAPAAADAAETMAVVAVAEGPAGLDADLAELTHQLRAACRDRVGDVLDAPTMQARLLGQSSGATLAELDRAYGGALAVYQNGEFESALRTLRAIVADLEALPEGREAWQQWIRAALRLAHAAATIGRFDEADAALAKLLRLEPNFRPDPDQYSPTYRRRVDDVRARVRALPQRRVTVLGLGRVGAIFVDGRPSGSTPMTLFLPAGRYRVGGAAGALRVPSFEVDVSEEDRTVTLDFETADAVRPSAGPGLALPAARRAEGIVRAGAWLDVDRLVVATRTVEGDAPFLVGAIYDVRRGALLREGSVRTVAGSVPTANVGALAAFLLTGAQQRDVRDRTPEGGRPPTAPAPAPVVAASLPVAALPAAPRPLDLRPAPAAVGPIAPAAALDEGGGAAPPPAPPRGWRRPAAWAGGGLAVGFAALALQRGAAANGAYGRAEALLGPNGVLRSAGDAGRYRSLVADGDAATRAAWISAAAAAALGAAAGYLGWTSAEPAPTAP